MSISIPERLSTQGDSALLSLPRRALLISRTPRRPVPVTPWVRSVAESVRRSVAVGEVVVTGVGRDPYELALRETQRRRGAAIVVLGGSLSEQPTDAEWRELLPERHLLVWREAKASEDATKPGRSSCRRNDEAKLRERDLLIGRLADRAWSIAVRRGGIMEEVAEELRQRGCAVEDGATSSENQGARPDPVSSIEHPASAVLSSQQPVAGSFLYHYTREPDGAWPGESRSAYLDWLIDGPRNSRRDAVDSLKRILAEGRIRASGRLMPNREPMISFTAAQPEEIAKLRRFRASLHRWDFRPYGIAIRCDVLERLGARPVRYLPESELKCLSADERLFAQKHEPPGTDWSAEAEWRLRGDLCLADLPREAIDILAPTREEAAALSRQLGRGAACQF